MSGSILRLEGLPFRITEDEINSFFAETESKIVRVHMLLNRDQRPSGSAYVEFESEADAKSAMGLDGKCIGDTRRYVKIVKADSDELRWQLQRQELHQSSDSSARFYCVRLYGVPYKVGEYEIAKWFQPVAPCVDVTIHLNHESRPSGDASAYFASEDDAKKSLEKDRADMNGRYINLAMDNVPVSFSHASGNTNSIRLSGLPFRATEMDIKEFFKPVTCQSVCVILNRDGRPSGDAIAEFATEEELEEAMKKDRENLGSRFIVLTRERDVGSQPSHRENRSGGGHRGGGGGGYGRGGGYGGNIGGYGDAGYGSGGDRFPRNNFAVRMSGLPYRASVDDIIQFFRPEVNCVSVRIVMNRDQRPSGEAIAEFETEWEAKTALQKNKQYLGDRFVILNPISFRPE